MPTFTMTKNWDDGTVLTESQLDDIKSSVETFLNTTKLDGDNIQTGGIPTAALANSCVTADKIATAVAGSGLTGGAGTALAVQVDGSTIEINADTLRVKDAGITQAKLADRTVGTTAAAGGVARSDSSGTFTFTSTSYTDVTNLAVASIVTTGRPIRAFLIPDGGNPAEVGSSNGGTITMKLLRDGATNVGEILFHNTTETPPCGGFQWLDDVPAGTYAYKIQVKGSAAVAHGVKNVRLVVYEM